MILIIVTLIWIKQKALYVIVEVEVCMKISARALCCDWWKEDWGYKGKPEGWGTLARNVSCRICRKEIGVLFCTMPWYFSNEMSFFRTVSTKAWILILGHSLRWGSLSCILRKLMSVWALGWVPIWNSNLVCQLLAITGQVGFVKIDLLWDELCSYY
jgi:hypothetical protein